MAAESLIVAKVLARYPDVSPSSLAFPPEAMEWSEKDVDLFVASGGFLKPKKKKNALVTDLHAPASAAKEEARPTVAACAIAMRAAAPIAAEPATSSGKASTPTRSPVAAGAQPEGANAASQSGPDATGEPLELGMTKWHEGQYWAPYTTYMEDVGERGLKLVAALNKCERFRNIGLKKGANFTLNDLKERFGAGILLREFALEVTDEPPRDIMSVLQISLRLELPCAPFMPMFQVVIPAGGGAPVCKAVFGMLMLETATMSVLSNNAIYEEVAAPLRAAFGIPKPTGAQGVPKFPRIYPARGMPFRPLQLFLTECTIMPSDCDMYRVIFHPQVVGVCERCNFAAGVPFREEPGVAIYANLARPAGIGDVFVVRIFVEPGHEGGPVQTRALYLFASAGKPGLAPAPVAQAASRCVLAAFMVYGSSPGQLFSEDVSACAASKMGALESFAAGGAAPAADKTIDLSSCARA